MLIRHLILYIIYISIAFFLLPGCNTSVWESNQGVKEFRKDNYEVAISHYSKAIEKDPSLYEAYYNRGVSYFMLGNMEKANIDFVKAYDLKPSSYLALYYRGVTKMALDDPTAIDDLNNVISMEPGYPEAYYSRGNFRHREGDFEGAIADYAKALELYPDYSSALDGIAASEKDRGDYEAALTAINRAIAINSKRNELYLHRAMIHIEMRNYNEAYVDLVYAIELTPRISALWARWGQ